MKRSTLPIGLAVLLVLGPPGRAGAQDAGAPRWEFVVAPYFMAPTMSGAVGTGTATADVEAGPGEIFDLLQFGAMITVEARRGPWALALDGLYMNLEQGAERVQLTAGAKQGAVELAGFRRLTPWAEALAGGRVNVLSASLEGQVLGSPVDESRDETWFDPIVGMRFTEPNTGKWSLSLRGDVGGFGIGSDFAWQVHPIVGYRLSRTVEMAAGYRYIGTDYENEATGFRYDVDTFGPELRLHLHF